MTISVIRETTTEDNKRVYDAAKRFCERHNIPYDDHPDEIFYDIEYWIEGAHPEQSAYRRKLWTGVFCRALRVPTDVRTTTDYGCVGITVD